jgi:hypothetical protein
MTTASKSVTESIAATHIFEVADFSLLDGMGVGKFVRSTNFSVGDCDWSIHVYPDGSKTEDNNGAYVSVYLYFRKGVAGVRVRFSLSLLNKDGSVLRLRDPILWVVCVLYFTTLLLNAMIRSSPAYLRKKMRPHVIHDYLPVNRW